MCHVIASWLDDLELLVEALPPAPRKVDQALHLSARERERARRGRRRAEDRATAVRDERRDQDPRTTTRGRRRSAEGASEGRRPPRRRDDRRAMTEATEATTATRRRRRRRDGGDDGRDQAGERSHATAWSRARPPPPHSARRPIALPLRAAIARVVSRRDRSRRLAPRTRARARTSSAPRSLQHAQWTKSGSSSSRLSSSRNACRFLYTWTAAQSMAVTP